MSAGTLGGVDDDNDDDDDNFFDAQSPPRTLRTSNLPSRTPPNSSFEFLTTAPAKTKTAGEMEDYIQINLIKNKGIQLPHILLHWTDYELNSRCTLFVWMLSGLEPRDVTARVLEGGQTLRLQFPWPNPFHDAMRLNKHSECDGSVKIVNMEKVIKSLKGGTFDATISSVVDFDLGMQVEEQFHNQPIAMNQVEKGNQLLRFFKDTYNRKRNKRENIPILIAKYEMMGIRDNYKNATTVDEDYEDEDTKFNLIENYFAAPSAASSNANPPSPSAPKKRRTATATAQALSASQAAKAGHCKKNPTKKIVMKASNDKKRAHKPAMKVQPRPAKGSSQSNSFSGGREKQATLPGYTLQRP